ncbi:hypothetical protein [Ramlibacter sp.]|uniref:hypothetical protein n=1 Tax=Ramlibacter sp. TaxID=1917967 RepID=UPI002631A516|nr:hypothetical protein [Ramlibacter sp.]MDB5956916.1 hypothetical protein [Ramlibacter sp.]
MNKPLLSRALVVAAVVAVAGVAQAETFNSPMQAGEASTMTGGAPNMLTSNDPSYSYSYDMGGPLPAPVVDSTVLGAGPMYDTTVLGGPPSVVYETTTVYPSSVYVQPNINWSPETYHSGWGTGYGGATATSRVPDRAGEASTIVNGVPNQQP